MSAELSAQVVLESLGFAADKPAAILETKTSLPWREAWDRGYAALGIVRQEERGTVQAVEPPRPHPRHQTHVAFEFDVKPANVGPRDPTRRDAFLVVRYRVRNVPPLP